MKKAALSDVFSDAAEVAGRYAKHGGQVLKRNLLQHILKKTFFDEAQVPADFPVFCKKIVFGKRFQGKCREYLVQFVARKTDGFKLFF